MKFEDATDQVAMHDCGAKDVVLRRISSKEVRFECDGCGKTWIAETPEKKLSKDETRRIASYLSNAEKDDVFNV